jgi:hypothetical protein
MAALASLAAAVALGGVAVNPVVGMAMADGAGASMTIDDKATLQEDGQGVELSGTYSCSQQATAVVVLYVLQNSGGGEAVGGDKSEVSCPAQNQKWTMKVHANDSNFASGVAQAAGTLKIDVQRVRSYRNVQIQE